MKYTIEVLTKLIGYAPPENSVAMSSEGIPYVVDDLDEDIDEEAVEWTVQAQRLVLFG